VYLPNGIEDRKETALVSRLEHSEILKLDYNQLLWLSIKVDFDLFDSESSPFNWLIV